MRTSDEIRAVVFDYDGTLVDSNELKVRAFYDLFPEECAGTIRAVLATDREQSRFTILAKIVETVGPAAEIAPRVAQLAERYNDIVQTGAATCAVFPGVVDLLERLAEHRPLYVSSGTPEQPLRAIIAARGWTRYFRGIYGYPRPKAEVVRGIAAAEGLTPAQVLVVGDGASDRTAAEETGAQFFSVTGPEWVAGLHLN